MEPQKYRLEASGYRYAKRIVDESGKVVAFTQELCNGMWCLQNRNGGPLDGPAANFKTPKEALKAYIARKEKKQ